MKQTNVVYKVQPETLVRKDLQYKQKYNKLKHEIDVRQGVVSDVKTPKDRVSTAREDSVRAIVELMLAESSNAEVQMWACIALGDIAREAMRPKTTYRSSAFNTSADNYETTETDLNLTIGIRGGIKAILSAFNNHRMEKGMVLRGCWALEHIVALDANRMIFEREGGVMTLEMIERTYPENDDIQKSVSRCLNRNRGGLCSLI